MKYLAILVGFAALALLLCPVAVQAAPCESTVVAPCTQDNPSDAAVGAPSAHRLTPAELQYHRDTVAHMEQTWGSRNAAAPAAIQAHAMTPAELAYHRDTVAHMGQTWGSRTASTPIQVHAMTPAELQYHRDTVAHMNSH